MKDLLAQIFKFGIVGVLAFFIDFGLFLLLDQVFGVHYLIASIISFTLSCIFNFVCSMRFVFEGKQNQTRLQQFVIFFTLSVVGLVLNSIILWACVDVAHIADWIGKLVATVLVMVFNFVTRKIFLEERRK